jgi:pimeloyl-ACP methyl ester carboxylesterase
MREHRLIELTMEDGQRVRGDYRFTPVDHPVPVVVFAHGLGSDRAGQKVAAFEVECARRGWALLAADFRGHGQSEGTMPELSGARLLEDLTAIVGAARQAAAHQVSGSPLLLVGSSMGGWAAAWLAMTRPDLVTACALIAPALRFFDWLAMTPLERQEWERTGRYRLRNGDIDLELGFQLCAEAPLYPYEALLERLTCPTIIFHGMQDATIPYQLSLDFVERARAARLELCLSRAGDHRLLTQRERMARASLDFFSQTIGQVDGD